MRYLISLFISCVVLTNYCDVQKQKFTLIIPLYNEKNIHRINEYITCLEKNLAHDAIEQVHVLYDETNDDNNNLLLKRLQEHSISISYIKRRQTFGDCFAIARQFYTERNVIISNADIFFNNTFLPLCNIDLTNMFIVLTPWNVHKNGSLHLRTKRGGVPAYDSQDVWIFRSPLPAFHDESIQIGTFGCENRIAFQANTAGLYVCNPCKTVQACHYHLSGIRHYSRKFPYHLSHLMKTVPCRTLEEVLSGRESCS